jgi:hypothetical protein
VLRLFQHILFTAHENVLCSSMTFTIGKFAFSIATVITILTGVLIKVENGSTNPGNNKVSLSQVSI